MNDSELTVDNLVEFIRRRGAGVSVIELKQEFDAAGDYFHEVVPNLFDMVNCSKELILTVGAAIRADRITERGCSVMVYFIDGEVCSLPIVKRIKKQGYKKPHWLPVVFNVVPKK